MDLEWLWWVNEGSSVITKAPLLVRDADNGEDHEGVGARDLWEISVNSCQFCSESKIAFLKNTAKEKTKSEKFFYWLIE